MARFVVFASFMATLKVKVASTEQNSKGYRFSSTKLFPLATDPS